MKRLSIKARVTVWYTVFMLLLVAAALAAVFFMSESLSRRKLQTQLIDAVSDTVTDVRFRHESLNAEELDFYKNAVSLFIYDADGYLLAPKLNMGIQVDSLLQDQTLRTVQGAGGRQLVYDVYALQDEVPFWVRGVISLEEAEQTYGSLRFLMLVIFPFFVLLAAVGGYRITRSAFRPISRMAETAERITSGEDLQERIETGKDRDELARLGHTMNGMLSRLQDSFENERQFTSDVSHELRTPLAVIRSQCEYALFGQAGEEEQQEALRSIYRQANRMSSMVSQLLLLSRADRGTFRLEKRPVDLSALAEGCCQDLIPAAEAGGITLRSEIQGGIRLSGDETLLTRLINNLLTNAIRYNRKDGSILLCLTKEGDRILLSVRDTGIGIRREEQDKIWNRFYRSDTSRSGEGAGLGLSMVQWIAKVHGGSVSLESEYGKGSCFLVELPVETGTEGKREPKGEKEQDKLQFRQN